MTTKGWSRPFGDEIALPDGGALRTLRDSGENATTLSKADQSTTHLQTAAHELLTAAERGGIPMRAEIVMRQVLAPGRPNLRRHSGKETVNTGSLAAIVPISTHLLKVAFDLVQAFSH